MFILLIIVGILILFIFLYLKFIKIRFNNLVLIDGTLGTGKSFLSVCWSINKYKKNLRNVKIKNWFRSKLHKPLLELPLLYSNIPLKCDFMPITRDIINGTERMAYKSVCLLDEASLIADCMTSLGYGLKTDDKQLLNDSISMFVKLYRHNTRGGTLFYNTQCIDDMHYAFKRATSQFYFIHSAFNIPFFRVMRIREMQHIEGMSDNNVNESDSINNTRLLICFKKWFKYYDSYTYFGIYKDKPINFNVVNGKDLSNLQLNGVVGFRNIKGINNYITFDYKLNIKKLDDEKKESDLNA